MRIFRTIFLLAILVAVTSYTYVTFQPRMRFAQPGPSREMMKALCGKYHCYYDQIYLGQSRSDTLFFGSSQTGEALDPKLVMNAYHAVKNERRQVSLFTTNWTNSGLMYFFFRDYLANNPAPKEAFFELTEVRELLPPVHYIHPFFPDLAPPYLYMDVLEPSELVHSHLFSVSDFLQLLLRHLDYSLSRLLVADYTFVVPQGDNCRSKQAQEDSFVAVPPRRQSFHMLLEAELGKTLPDVGSGEIGKPPGLFKTFEGDAKMTRLTEDKVKKWSAVGGTTGNEHFWMEEGAKSSRSLDYYQRIVKLGEANNVKIGFYYMPGLLSPRPPRVQVDELASTLGAPVYHLPFGAVEVSYHHYRDAKHVSKVFRPVYSTWFASLID